MIPAINSSSRYDKPHAFSKSQIEELQAPEAQGAQGDQSTVASVDPPVKGEEQYVSLLEIVQLQIMELVDRFSNF